MSWEALATFIAAAIALALGLWPICEKRAERKCQARIVAVQVLHYLQHLKALLNKKSQHEVVLFSHQYEEMFRDLRLLWSKGDLLSPDQFCSFTLVMSELVRHTKAGNYDAKSEQNVVQVIENACKVFETDISKYPAV